MDAETLISFHPTHREQGELIASRFSASPKRAAVIDIGSNSIKMTVYNCEANRPPRIFDEDGAICGLARDMHSHATPMLNSDAIKLAYKKLGDFRELINKHEVDTLYVIGTAALRAVKGTEACNLFCASAAEILGRGSHVNIITGEHEALLTGLGVLYGIPGASGLVWGMGGGSMETCRLIDGNLGNNFSVIEQGALTLFNERKLDKDHKIEVVDKLLRDDINNNHLWMTALAGKVETFYPVGSTPRAVIRFALEEIDRMPIVAHYPNGRSMFFEEIRSPLQRMTAMTSVHFDRLRDRAKQHMRPKDYEKYVERIDERAPYIPIAAQAMLTIADIIKPSRLALPGYGMREGTLLSVGMG